MPKYSYKDKEYHVGGSLKMYASGNGALSFVFERQDEAISSKITRRDIVSFLKDQRPELMSWLITDKDTCGCAGFQIFQPCKRVANDELELPNGLTVTYEQKGPQHIQLWNEEGLEVKNISMKSQALFYLNNEGIIDDIVATGRGNLK